MATAATISVDRASGTPNCPSNEMHSIRYVVTYGSWPAANSNLQQVANGGPTDGRSIA